MSVLPGIDGTFISSSKGNIELVTSYFTSAAQASYTFSSNTAPAAGRMLVWSIGASSNQRTISNLTVGGSNSGVTTLVTEAAASESPRNWVWFDHYGGTLPTIVTSYGIGVTSHFQLVFRLSDFSSMQYIGNATTGIGSGNSDTNRNITSIPGVQPDDWVVGAAKHRVETSRTNSWTELTEILDETDSTNYTAYAGLKQYANAVSSGWSIVASSSGSVGQGADSVIILRFT